MLKTVCIDNLPEAREILYSEMQNGFYMESAEGESIRTFLTDFCGMTGSFIKEKIKTVFHNGSPVDDLDSVKIHDGSVCAVSGAMPGLVGAMMRMGSPYASMRESITDRGEHISPADRTVFVRLKLFNVILSELGNKFISSGIILDRSDVERVMEKIRTVRGSDFPFKVDDSLFKSLKAGMFSDEKYIVKISLVYKKAV